MAMLKQLVAIALLIVSALLGTTRALPNENPSLKIGFILPLSGDWAFLGNGIRDGALMAQEDLRAKGTSIELIFEDNRGELAPSAALGLRLISDRHIDALVSIISGVGKILKPMAEKASIVNIGICSDTEVADGRNSFINYLTAEQGVAKFVEYFPRALPSASLGVFALNEAGFQRILNELERQSAGKFKIIRVETFNKGTVDFRSQLIKMKSTQPGSILLLGLSPEIELIAKQAQSLKFHVPFTSIEGFGLASDKSPFEGEWFVDSAVPSDVFQKRFAAKYGRDVTPGVGHSYDSVMLLAQAAEATKSNHLNLAQSIRDLPKYEGVIGQLSVRHDGIIWSDASIKMIKDGKPVKMAL